MDKIYLGWILGILTIIAVAAQSEGICTKESCGPGSNNILMQINNPYAFDVDVEIKCDWNSDKQAFDFYKKLNFPSQQATSIVIPKSHKLCEIWPHVKLFD